MGFKIVIFAFWWSIAGGQALQAEGSNEPQQENDASATERRIIAYLKENLRPGEPLIFSRLYNEVFTKPEEREALGRLNGVFFRVPLFLVKYREGHGELPTLDEIAGQFDLYGAEEVDVVLSVMESDPRVPRFIRRDPGSGEVLELDVEKIRSDPRFNKPVEQDLSWEGEIAPDVGGPSFAGPELSLSQMKDKAVLLYVWFTNCPPCVRMTPGLVEIQKAYSSRGFTVLGANADRVLDLSYDDQARVEYVEKHAINFPNFHLSEEDLTRLGNVNIFPTLFLIGPDRVVAKYYVNYQPRHLLEADIDRVLASGASRSD